MSEMVERVRDAIDSELVLRARDGGVLVIDHDSIEAAASAAIEAMHMRPTGEMIEAGLAYLGKHPNDQAGALLAMIKAALGEKE